MQKIIGIVLICILLISVFFIGKSLGSAGNTAPAVEATGAEEATERNLRISVTYDKDAGLTTIPLEQGSYKEVQYWFLSSATIDIDGTTMKLEDALQDGFITVDEIIAYARQDASQKLCYEVAKSNNGLTEFTYYYHDLRLHYIYDLYETPDGKRHLITEFAIYATGGELGFSPAWDEETGQPIDFEDWGLHFEVSRADASGLTVTCSQSGGQQMGELYVGDHFLYRKDPNAPDLVQVEPLNPEEIKSSYPGFERWNPEPEGVFLTMGGTKELSFDLMRLYGELPAGDYVISLQIVDWYDPEQVPSLMRNYYDAQRYPIEFTIE